MHRWPRTDRLRRALDFCGLGSDALRLVPVDLAHQINLAALRHMIESDRAPGITPFLMVGTAGTVDIGAIDDLDGLAVVASEERMWLHVDGAYGALGILAPEIAPRLAGIEAADSLAFDFHKWGQVPYDAGFVLVRDGELHRKAFASPAAYLERETRGLAAGSPWPCDFGPDLSRGFRALKTWFTLKVYGLQALGRDHRAHLRAGALSGTTGRPRPKSWSSWRRCRSTSFASAIDARTPTG